MSLSKVWRMYFFACSCTEGAPIGSMSCKARNVYRPLIPDEISRAGSAFPSGYFLVENAHRKIGRYFRFVTKCPIFPIDPTWGFPTPRTGTCGDGVTSGAKPRLDPPLTGTLSRSMVRTLAINTHQYGIKKHRHWCCIILSIMNAFLRNIRISFEDFHIIHLRAALGEALALVVAWGYFRFFKELAPTIRFR